MLLSASVANATLAEAQALELGTSPYYATEPYTYFLEDTSHRLTIDDVTQQQLSRFQTLANKGGDANWAYSSATIWLAIPVATAKHSILDWLVEVGFATLDNVEIYVPRQAGGFDMQTAGDLQPFAERPFTHRNLVFPIHIAPNSHETIFLKITSRGSMTIPVKFWQHDALHYQDQISYSTLSIYFGSLLALGIYSLLIYLSVREKIFLVYVAFVTSMAVSQASLCGFGNQFVWSNWISWGDIAFPAGTAAAGFFGTLFSRIYLTTQERFPKIDRLFLWMAAVFAFAAVSVLFVPYRYSAILTGSSGFVFAALATWSGFYCMRHGHKGARLFLIAWMMLLIGVALQALRNFDLIVTNNITLHGMQIGSALEMLLLAFALADRFNLMREEKELAQDEALMAKQLMVDTLRQSEHELEQKVLDRTHAMNMANQLLRENEIKLQHMALHDPLTGLGNRLMLNETLDKAIARSQRDNTILAFLLIDLDGFKEVNDTLGHSAGDILLQMIAKRLKTTTRNMDTIARLGGDEFVVLLENLSSTDAVFRVADQLIQQISLPVELPVGSARVSASIGIAFYPQSATNALQLFKTADKAMYAAKASGRNRWCVAE